MACLMMWCNKEVEDFVKDRFSLNVFLPSVPLSVSCESVSILRHQANRLRNTLGLDLLFNIDSLLREETIKTIEDSKTKLVESIKSKLKDESWQSVNLNSIPGVDKFLSEVKEVDLRNILKSYVFDEHKLSLASSIAFFAKSYLTLTSDWMKLSTPFSYRIILRGLLEVVKPPVDAIESALRSEGFKKDAKFIRRNAVFLLDQLIPLVNQAYQEKTGSSFKELHSIKLDYEHLKGESRNESKTSGGRRPSNGSANREETTKRRAPSKSTVSISDGKIVSTTTYL